MRNRGLGIRAGVGWNTAREAAATGRGPQLLEFGAFFQRPFALRESVQVEALYFAQRHGVGAARHGLRLPVLLVVNLFENVAIHFGPQLQLAKLLASPTPDEPSTFRAMTWTAVAGAEAHVERLRIGARYGTGFSSLKNATSARQALLDTWYAGNIQVYLSADLLR